MLDDSPTNPSKNYNFRIDKHWEEEFILIINIDIKKASPLKILLDFWQGKCYLDLNEQ